jgi:hypothetical protein
MAKFGHWCANQQWSEEFAHWVYDAQGIELCKVCSKCRKEKLSRFRPEILSGYDQSDVDENIDEE